MSVSATTAATHCQGNAKPHERTGFAAFRVGGIGPGAALKGSLQPRSPTRKTSPWNPAFSNMRANSSPLISIAPQVFALSVQWSVRHCLVDGEILGCRALPTL